MDFVLLSGATLHYINHRLDFLDFHDMRQKSHSQFKRRL